MESLTPMTREAVFAQLAQQPPGSLALICVSRRLAQHLFEAYANARAEAGALAWETPAILPLDAFLRECAWAAGASDRHHKGWLPPLSAAEERLLWSQVLEDTRDELPLLREREAARLAQEAWALVQDYNLSLPLTPSTPEVEQFNDWAARFQRKLRDLKRLDGASWRRELLRAIAQGTVPVPRRVVLAGFDVSSTPVQALLAALRSAGVELGHCRDDGPPVCPQLVRAADPERELRAAAEWARERALTNPKARIGVIVPDISARRAQVQRVFDEQLCPQVEAVDAHSPSRPYDLSLGISLADTALVGTALRLLQLIDSSLPAGEASALLCAPHWGRHAQERLQRAQLDARLRREGYVELSAGTLLAVAAGTGELEARLQTLSRLRAGARSRRPSEWIEVLEQWLAQAGWPGPRSLDSEEYQSLRAWHESLRELGRLDALMGRISFSSLLAVLREQMAATVFQTQVLGPRIHVLGALEAEGLRFDHLWVCRLDDEHWPPPSRPHPFLPFALQRSHGLPHASPAQELAYARAVTQRWCQATAELVLSWPEQVEDRPLAPSPLLAQWLAEARPATSPPLSPHWARMFGSAVLETLVDAQAAPLAAQGVQRGGARLLADQARCPLRAFARHRLGAQGLEVPAPGLSAADRGNLVHAVLQALWTQLRDQQTLRALSAEDRAALVGNAVDQALDALARTAPQRLPDGLRALEGERLISLVQAWLDQELLRSPFRVLELEGQRMDGTVAADVVNFEGLSLRLRRDRVDEIDGGGRIVIDYKTGARKKAPWDEGRPEEPQLLLYALTETHVDGVAYARLLPGDLTLEGVARIEDVGLKVRHFTDHADTKSADSWEALLGRWRGELRTLVEELQSGWAAVSPKHPRQSCRDCDLHAFCRVQDSLPQGDDEEEIA